jgi:hypothetical protein
MKIVPIPLLEHHFLSSPASATMVEKALSVTSETPSRTWKGWLWDSADVSKEERKFLLKVVYQADSSCLPC